MQRRMYGLSLKDLRKLANVFAEKASAHHPFKKEVKMAGKDWAKSFLERHGLCISQPQATSVSRVIGFKRPQVDRFFSLYKECLEEHEYMPSKIWNMDETGVTTIQKPGQILAEKGMRQVGKATSAQRCELVTLICAFNAAGGFLPPMYIFPRKRMIEALM